MTGRKASYLDALYGSIGFDDDLATLVATPVVQRLRHVRLSNIDSIDLPGIANLSRFEHVLGGAHLAGAVGFHRRLNRFDSLALRAGALLHDWAITSFGHLVEEAFQYLDTGFDHEERLKEIVSGENPEEVGGVQRQILVGRETGLRSWAHRVVAPQNVDELLVAITEHIRGHGRLGRVVSGAIDIDNIDNVFRMAHHMGLEVDRAAPIRLAQAMIAVTGEHGEPVFHRSAVGDIELWRSTRRAVYQHLMLAERDFIGKLMMLFATVRAYEAGEISTLDWGLVDYQFVSRLLESKEKEISDTVERWVAGELWNCTPLRWMTGERPSYAKLLLFSRALAQDLDRSCFAYGIKDKRDRRLSIAFDDGSRRDFGEDAAQWLLGIGSPKRAAFTARETEIAFTLARDTFGSELVDRPALAQKEAQACLF